MTQTEMPPLSQALRARVASCTRAMDAAIASPRPEPVCSTVRRARPPPRLNGSVMSSRTAGSRMGPVLATSMTVVPLKVRAVEMQITPSTVL